MRARFLAIGAGVCLQPPRGDLVTVWPDVGSVADWYHLRQSGVHGQQYRHLNQSQGGGSCALLPFCATGFGG